MFFMYMGTCPHVHIQVDAEGLWEESALPDLLSLRPISQSNSDLAYVPNLTSQLALGLPPPSSEARSISRLPCPPGIYVSIADLTSDPHTIQYSLYPLSHL